MVKPGGTGSPALVISARPAPLPPSTSFMPPLPSALPSPKKYTYFAIEPVPSVHTVFCLPKLRFCGARREAARAASSQNSTRTAPADQVLRATPATDPAWAPADTDEAKEDDRGVERPVRDRLRAVQ